MDSKSKNTNGNQATLTPSREEQVQLESYLGWTWHHMEDLIPVVINLSQLFKGSIQHKFASLIDGALTSKELAIYLTLEPIQMFVTLVDLKDAGVIDLIRPSERVQYFRRMQDELREELHFMIEEKAKAVGELTVLQDKNLSLRNSVKPLENEQVELKTEAQGLQSTLESVVGQLKQLTQDNSKMKSNLKELIHQREALEQIVSQMELEHEHLLKSRETLLPAVAAMRAELMVVEQKKTDLKPVLDGQFRTISDIGRMLYETQNRVSAILRTEYGEAN
jgi:predicted nuclease with TOPRIM domain